MKSNIIKFISNDFLVGLGNSIFNLVIMWYTLERTGSAFYTASIGALSHIAQITIGSYAGIKADQFNQPVKMMVYSLRMNSIILLVICICIGILNINIYGLIFLLLLREIIMVFQLPNQNILIPRLCLVREDIKKVISYRSLTKNLSMMIGFSIAGFLYLVMSFPTLLIIILTLFIVSSLIINNIKVTQSVNFDKKHLKEKKHFEEFKSTLKMILQDYYLKRVLINSVLLNIISMVAPTFVVYFNQYLKAGSSDYGLFQFLIALGSVLAATFGMRLKKIISPYSILLTFWLLMSVSFIYMYVNSSTSVAITLGIVIGVCLTLPTILFSTYKIVIMEDNYRGRISGMIQSISTVSIPIAYYFSAYISDYYGANMVFLIAGVIQLFILIFLSFDKRLKLNFNEMV
ncbi:MFS transporter [Mammaliicoccus lentus]|uniref:MFS transporter n=1 Tax=Mammaliicoccus lentus TaxID=42858 RepID=UPI00107289DD|nr:MFS transporter [Mammaliicoccus lentus]MBF0795551.1 MFS transporter [Mammaliicoccus lentus]MCR1871603.1 MFS transporter [Mammaliicoccus lentus]TFV14063.1 hypothetical protein E4T78_12845 [Mammaliicoccus lentus]